MPHQAWIGWARPYLTLLSAAGSLVLAGCGSSNSGPQRVPLRGSVVWNSEPADALVLNIVPAQNHGGPAANIQIHHGKYAFTSLNGPSAGPHDVTITYYPNRTGGPGGAEHNPKAPDKQTSWKFEIDVPETGPFEEDFNLDDVPSQ